MRELPTEVIDREGRVMGVFKTPTAAVAWAQAKLPGEQETGDGPDPTGWDIRPAHSTD